MLEEIPEHIHFSPRVRQNHDRTSHIIKSYIESTGVPAGSTLEHTTI